MLRWDDDEEKWEVCDDEVGEIKDFCEEEEEEEGVKFEEYKFFMVVIVVIFY